jgi:hypothetical protein
MTSSSSAIRVDFLFSSARLGGLLIFMIFAPEALFLAAF